MMTKDKALIMALKFLKTYCENEGYIPQTDNCGDPKCYECKHEKDLHKTIKAIEKVLAA
jgi:hypothetical protein